MTFSPSRIPLVAAALAAALLSTAPAAADAPPDRSIARHPVPSRYGAAPEAYGPGRHAARPYRHRRPSRPQGHGFGPGFDAGYVDAGFGAGHGGPAVTLYREAYIGRGLIYNTPPQPYWPGSDVISVRY